MMNTFPFMHSAGWGVVGLGIGFMTLVFVIWSLFWKGWALWLAARRGEKIWFLVMLVVNTLGILEIIYIFAIAKQSDAPKPHEHHDHHGHEHHDHPHTHEESGAAQ